MSQTESSIDPHWFINNDDDDDDDDDDDGYVGGLLCKPEQLRPSHWIWLTPLPRSIHQPAVCWTLPLRNPATDVQGVMLYRVHEVQQNGHTSSKTRSKQKRHGFSVVCVCVYHQTVKQISLWHETDMLSSLSIFPLQWPKKHDIPWRLEDFERRSRSLHQAQKFEVAKNINKRYNTKSTPEKRALKTSCRLEWGPNRLPV